MSKHHRKYPLHKSIDGSPRICTTSRYCVIFYTRNPTAVNNNNTVSPQTSIHAELNQNRTLGYQSMDQGHSKVPKRVRTFSARLGLIYMRRSSPFDWPQRIHRVFIPFKWDMEWTWIARQTSLGIPQIHTLVHIMCTHSGYIACVRPMEFACIRRPISLGTLTTFD